MHDLVQYTLVLIYTELRILMFYSRSSRSFEIYIFTKRGQKFRHSVGIYLGEKPCVTFIVKPNRAIFHMFLHRKRLKLASYIKISLGTSSYKLTALLNFVRDFHSNQTRPTQESFLRSYICLGDAKQSF